MAADMQELTARAKLLISERQYAEAVRVCRRVLLSYADAYEIRVLLGVALLALQRYEEVRAEMLSLLRAGENRDPTVYRLLGEAYLRDGHAEKAADSLRMALTLDPDDARARELLTEVDEDEPLSSPTIERWFDPEAVATVQTTVPEFEDPGTGKVKNPPASRPSAKGPPSIQVDPSLLAEASGKVPSRHPIPPPPSARGMSPRPSAAPQSRPSALPPHPSMAPPVAGPPRMSAPPPRMSAPPAGPSVPPPPRASVPPPPRRSAPPPAHASVPPRSFAIPPPPGSDDEEEHERTHQISLEEVEEIRRGSAEINMRVPGAGPRSSDPGARRWDRSEAAVTTLRSDPPEELEEEPTRARSMPPAPRPSSLDNAPTRARSVRPLSAEPLENEPTRARSMPPVAPDGEFDPTPARSQLFGADGMSLDRPRIDSEPPTFSDLAGRPPTVSVKDIAPALASGRTSDGPRELTIPRDQRTTGRRLAFIDAPNRWAKRALERLKSGGAFLRRRSRSETPVDPRMSVHTGSRRPARAHRGDRRRLALMWTALISAPVLAGMVTFFSVRSYFARKADAEIEAAVERATDDGFRTSLESALQTITRRSHSDADRIALRARLLATAALEHGDERVAEAKKLLGELDPEDRTLVNAQIAEGYLWLMRGDPGAALATVRSLGGSVRGEAGSEALHLQALAAAAQGRPQQALTFANRAVALWPTSVRHAALQAWLTASAGDASAALAALDAFSGGERLPAIRVTRARVLQESGGDPVRAVAEANAVLTELAVLATPSQKAWSHLIRARHAASSGDAATALTEARAASAIPWFAEESFRLSLAETLLRAGAASEARRELAQLSPTSSNTVRRARLSAEVALALGDLIAAEKALKDAGDGARADLLRGRLQEARGKLDQARVFYEKAAKDPREFVASRVRLASMELANGQVAKAVELLDAARKRAPGDLEVVPLSVRALLDVGRVTDAESTLKVALTLQSDAPELLAARAAVEQARGLFEAAYTTLREAVRRRPGDPEFQAALGQAARRAGRGDEARRAFDQALRLSPNLPAAFVGLAQLAVDAGNIAEAKTYLSRAEESGRAGLEGARARARLFVVLGDGESGADAVKTLVDVYPDAELFSALGTLYVQAERDNDATAAFSKALSLDSNNAEALLGRTILDARRGNLASAARLVGNAERAGRERGLGPSFLARIDAARGRLRFELGDFTSAGRYAKEAIEKDPKAADAHLLLANVAIERGKDAIGHLRDAVAGKAPPPEAVGRLATLLPHGPEACDLGKRYMKTASRGYDAANVKSVLQRCGN